MSKTENIFSATQKFTEAIQLINDISASKLAKVLSRLIKKLHLQGSDIFTEIEETQLAELLQFSLPSLRTAFTGCSFIFQEAAYHFLSPKNFNVQLSKTELQEEQRNAFIEIWKKEGENYISKLKKRTLFPHILKNTEWELKMIMGSSTLSRQKQPVALLALHIGKETDQEEDRILNIELTHSELFELYEQLESIQEALDSVA
eukprot:GCRY01001006.1.p1 GENE.GCRY01001006.1~~GCRY01001006.1.p1  ORF type:complete len:203 (+),score=35.60 GCRY01001006.1:198-806(+)